MTIEEEGETVFRMGYDCSWNCKFRRKAYSKRSCIYINGWEVLCGYSLNINRLDRWLKYGRDKKRK